MTAMLELFSGATFYNQSVNFALSLWLIPFSTKLHDVCCLAPGMSTSVCGRAEVKPLHLLQRQPLGLCCQRVQVCVSIGGP